MKKGKHQFVCFFFDKILQTQNNKRLIFGTRTLKKALNLEHFSKSLANRAASFILEEPPLLLRFWKSFPYTGNWKDPPYFFQNPTEEGGSFKMNPTDFFWKAHFSSKVWTVFFSLARAKKKLVLCMLFNRHVIFGFFS